MSAAFQPHTVFDISPLIIRLIWPIDEYAIRDFRSVCRKQIILVMTAPHRDNLIIGAEINLFIFIIIDDKRIRPYLPNFSRIPARIIDPATGASTCAFGNHKCSIYRGIFVKNAIIVIIHQIIYMYWVMCVGCHCMVLNLILVRD